MTRMKKVYVRMTDRFMSGWGLAANKINVMVVECDDFEQAEAIERAAQARPEMKRVSICIGKPKSRAGVLYTWKGFADLGGPWLAYYRPQQKAA